MALGYGEKLMMAYLFLYCYHYKKYLHLLQSDKLMSSSAVFQEEIKERSYRCWWSCYFLLYKCGGLVQVSLWWLDKKQSVRYYPVLHV